MRKYVLLVITMILITGTTYANGVKIGDKLPLIDISQKGLMVPKYDIKDGKMIYKDGTKIGYKKWNSTELTGKVGVVYHLAARSGIEDINKPFIDALIAADLPEYLPESPYKTTTILNIDDAAWGTAGIASGRFESSQKETAYAYFINDEGGVAKKSWGLKPKGSAVIIHDKEGKVLYFKDGKMSGDEIKMAVSLIEKKLGVGM